ncbi:hypothetical protein H4V95_002076 [Arthrobacter sp. CAN_C5]|nr:hypothetical protein [Arthrobacter sp. CAN_C5]
MLLVIHGYVSAARQDAGESSTGSEPAKQRGG